MRNVVVSVALAFAGAIVGCVSGVAILSMTGCSTPQVDSPSVSATPAPSAVVSLKWDTGEKTGKVGPEVSVGAALGTYSVGSAHVGPAVLAHPVTGESPLPDVVAPAPPPAEIEVLPPAAFTSPALPECRPGDPACDPSARPPPAPPVAATEGPPEPPWSRSPTSARGLPPVEVAGVLDPHAKRPDVGAPARAGGISGVAIGLGVLVVLAVIGLVALLARARATAPHAPPPLAP